MSRTLVGILCGLGAASIWGGMYVVSKVVLDVIPPFTLVTLRLVRGNELVMAGNLTSDGREILDMPTEEIRGWMAYFSRKDA